MHGWMVNCSVRPVKVDIFSRLDSLGSNPVEIDGIRKQVVLSGSTLSLVFTTHGVLSQAGRNAWHQRVTICEAKLYSVANLSP